MPRLKSKQRDYYAEMMFWKDAYFKMYGDAKLFAFISVVLAFLILIVMMR